jgi:hypothetical protein
MHITLKVIYGKQGSNIKGNGVEQKLSLEGFQLDNLFSRSPFAGGKNKIGLQ